MDYASPEQNTARTITEIPALPKNQTLGTHDRPLNVAAYCRVSTDSEEQLNSYKSQIEYYTGIIDENPGWRNAGIFADEGLSAVSTKRRAEFNKMIQKCRAGRVDLIITKSVSRFARNTLDSITYARKLKTMGVGIIFEKEGVNTLEMDDEILLTIFSSLAQAESESLSKNVAMGFRQAFKAGKAVIHYKGFLGYRKGENGQPEIVPEEAAIVRRIFHRYLAGDSIAQLKRGLEADRIPTATGKAEWSVAALRYMLRNEKYAGDVLMQKTYVSDVLTKRAKKNNGELPQYLISNNHEPIIERDIFNKVQEEISRRAAKLKTPSRTAKTEQSKYSGKYALNEILTCAECGSPYRRVTWTQNGEKRAVWRCISRLEHGRKRCGNSPTLDESALHAAILDALGEVTDTDTIADALSDCSLAARNADERTTAYLAAKRRVAELDALLDKYLALSVTAGEDEAYYDDKCREIVNERAGRQATIAGYEATHAQMMQAPHAQAPQTSQTFTPIDTLTESLAVTQFDEKLSRQLLNTIKVHANGSLQITLKGGEQITRQMPINRRGIQLWQSQQSGLSLSMN